MTRLQRGIQLLENKFQEMNENEYVRELDKTSVKAVAEKRNLSKKFELVDGNNLQNVINGNTFYVTKKLDGIFTLCCLKFDYNTDTVVVCNSSGAEIANLACIEELKKIGATHHENQTDWLGMHFLMELYMPGKKRTRVADVLHALSCEKKDELCLAPFYHFGEHKNYGEMHRFMTDFFAGAKQIHPVPMEKVIRAEDESLESVNQRVKDIYNRWVVEEGAEGLVVRNENDVIWKIKPRHSIDAAAIGYALDSDGTLRDIMFAVMDKDGEYHRFACGATGLSYDEKNRLLNYFKTKKVHSENFLYANSLGINYDMVVPEKVFEINCVDLASTRVNNEPCKNDLLVYDAEKGWHTKGLVNGASCHGLSIFSERKDKKCVYEDIRLEQLSELDPFEPDEMMFDLSKLPQSELAERYAFVKKRGKGLYAKKFLIWRTNKHLTDLYPPYILYYEDYSNKREEHITYDMFAFDNFNEAKEALDTLISKKVKGGWTYVYGENAL